MIKQISISGIKNVLKIYKANTLKKLQMRKTQNEINRKYIMNAIQEAEEDLANGGKTYTLEEFEERMEQLYGKI